MRVYKAVRLALGQLCCLFHIFRDLSHSGKQTDPSQSPPGVGNVAPQYHLKPYEFRIQYPPFKALNFVPIG